MYPVIVLDEFQDTNSAQWGVIRALGECCRLMALADPEQRIYDRIGVDPAYLRSFKRGVCRILGGSGVQPQYGTCLAFCSCLNKLETRHNIPREFYSTDL
ncbi:UvrD-helicase domain-containing protein [Xylella taiwanensis]|uniref:UvrD-helicase domain-containing protein n=2 Tax=Xylella taiwanensis TaxID=1444770 RepID=A0ABS8TRD3_9GAMM|nr:UvrD-helicase domain-containing protein [Xylella taiwanensis]MCD8457463.1 UvrD-helicase domain-containing protein [Xylella taiwanensis]MCD8457621.1 UvrD-helicase domain-containing protein [Xylella taiwanensis]MCD8461254.1 UvrD-helicase domain-containing protein [Xylella taiwanensis]MCD8462711.1 UvrD-helicase domain-containing protein [Xylella taiwanensis]MCD8466497.1 UvrD-helicase domain-containing protein [Xylella taiwanensis]